MSMLMRKLVNREAIFDLAWPSGLQPGLTQPVAVLLGETPEVIALASKAGFRCFTDIESFKNYVKHDVLKEENNYDETLTA